MIGDKAINPSANVRLTPIGPIKWTTSTSQTAATSFITTPGYRFRVHRVEVFATAVTATITVDVLIGSTSVLSAQLTPVANTVVVAAPGSGLVAEPTRTAASAAQSVSCQYTSNGTGAATNLSVMVWLRPYPMNGEA